MQVDVLNQKGQKVAQVNLNAAIFDIPNNAALIAQAIRVRLTNARAGTANVKVRDEVSGGGRKPWRQKGTGRARQGSIRAPQWRGGGVVHGPRVRVLELVMPKQMRRKALFSSLSEKVRQNQLVVLDDLNLDKAKTSQLNEIMQALPVGKTSLVVLPAKMETVERSARNLPDLKVTTARVLHPYEVMHYQTVVMLQDSLAVLEQTFLNKLKASSAQRPEEKKVQPNVETKVAKTPAKPIVSKTAVKKAATSTKKVKE
jgi:large subunit ribosomal protein L4